MKKVTVAFMVFGILSRLLTLIQYLIMFSVGIYGDDPLFVSLLGVGTLVAAGCIALGIVTIRSIEKGNKLIWLGVLALLFVSTVGGILYFCWKPENEIEPEEETTNIEDTYVIPRPSIEEIHKNEEANKNN